MDATPVQVTPLELRDAIAVVQPLVSGIDEQDWLRPTPCDGWTVHDLVNHVVAGNLLFAGVLEDRGTVQDLRVSLAGDHLAADPVGAFAAAGDAVVAAFSAPGALERTVTVPFGTVPASVALHLRITEILVHGWDLAQALGRHIAFDDATVHHELGFSRTFAQQVPPERKAFAPPESVADDATPLDQLVALLGRRP